MDVMWTSKMLMHAFLNFVLQISVDLAEIAFCKIFKVTIYHRAQRYQPSMRDEIDRLTIPHICR